MNYLEYRWNKSWSWFYKVKFVWQVRQCDQQGFFFQHYLQMFSFQYSGRSIVNTKVKGGEQKLTKWEHVLRLKLVPFTCCMLCLLCLWTTKSTYLRHPVGSINQPSSHQRNCHIVRKWKWMAKNRASSNSTSQGF